MIAASSPTKAATAAGTIQTVLGPLDTSQLGFTLTHEHLGGWTPEFRAQWLKSRGDRAGYIAAAVQKLTAIRKAGVDSIVDLSTYDVGRDVRVQRELSMKSGVARRGVHRTAYVRTGSIARSNG